MKLENKKTHEEIEEYYGKENYKKIMEARDHILDVVENYEFEEAMAAWMNISFQSLELIMRSAEADEFTSHMFWKKFESCMLVGLAEMKKIWIQK